MQKIIRENEIFLIRIRYENPRRVVYKNIRAINYPDFLDMYPKEVLLQGLEVSEIRVVKKYKSYEKRTK